MLKNIVSQESKSNISLRILFIIKDIITLRENKWINQNTKLDKNNGK